MRSWLGVVLPRSLKLGSDALRTQKAVTAMKLAVIFSLVALVHLYELDAEKIDLPDLLIPWLECHSMATAFTHHGGLKVFFLDRLIDSTRLLGHFHHVEFMEPFSLPIFLRDGLARSWVSHRVVAVVAHLGNSLQGHFRALLLDPITGKKWLCDDNERPQEIMVIPEYFHTRGVLFWTLPCQDLDLEDSEADGMQGLTPSSVPLNLGHETLGTTCPVPTHDQAITASPEEDASWEPRPFLEGLTAAHPSLDLDAPGPMLGLPLRDDSEGRALENSSRSDTATWPQSHAVQEVAPSQPLEEDSALGVLLQRLQDADASITRALAAGPAPLADE